MKIDWSTLLRYLASGGLNTVVTYVIYLGLLGIFNYTVSYVLAFVLGLFLTYLLQRYFVFGKSGGRFGWLVLSISYLCQLALGTLLVRLWVQTLEGPQALAPLFSLALTVPLMFMVSRHIFRHKNGGGL